MAVFLVFMRSETLEVPGNRGGVHGVIPYINRMRIQTQIVFAALLLFLSCSEQVDQKVEYQDAKPTGAALLLVRDARTGLAVSGVVAYPISSPEDSGISDSLGVVAFEDLAPGLRLFQLEKEGYASVQVQLTLQDAGGDVPMVADVEQAIAMRPLLGRIQGLVTLPEALPAEGAEVRIEVLQDLEGIAWVQSVWNATVDQDGEFLQEDLPWGALVVVRVMAWEEDGVTYGVSADTVRVGVGDRGSLLFALQAQLRPLEILFINSEKFSLLASDSELVVRFSDAVDPASLPGEGKLVTQSGVPVLVQIRWLDFGRELRLAPLDGEWEAGEEYGIHLGGLQSENGAALSLSGVDSTFMATASLTVPQVVDAIRLADTLDWNSTQARISWNGVENAESYQIWIQDSGVGAFHFFATVQDSFAVVPTQDQLENGAYLAIRVVASNSSGNSAVAESPVVVLQDVRKPRILTFADWNVNPDGLDNTRGTSPKLLGGTGLVSFSEPMDTSATPAFTVRGDLSATVALRWSWNPDRLGGSIALSVLAEQNASGLDIELEINSATLRDAAGNALEKPTSVLGRAVVGVTP